MKTFLSLIALTLSLYLSGQAYVIDNFDVELALEEEGTLLVTEKIDVTFNQRRRGIFRTLPTKYDFEGNKIILDILDIDVSGHQYQVSRKGSEKEIRIGNKDTYLTGEQSYVINYTLQYPIIQHENYQELYWNVTGNSWDTDIRSASLVIKLPKDLALSTDDLAVWTGKQGDKSAQAKFTQENTTSLTAKTDNVLRAGEGMTIAMKMPSDYLDIPEAAKIRSSDDIITVSNPMNRKAWWFAIPLMLLSAIVTIWKNHRSREIQPKYQEEFEEYPPNGFTSAHIGGYIDHTVHKRDVLSLLPYWASEGYLTMRYDRELILEKEKHLPDNFPVYEQELFDRIFKDDNKVRIESLDGALHGAISHATRSIQKEIKLQEYYDENYNYWWKSWRTLVGVLVSIAAGVLTLIFLKLLWLGIGLIVVGVGIAILSAFTSPLSPKGKNMMARLEAFQRFVKDPPADRLSAVVRDDTNYFDKIFPFAVAFGADKAWMKSIEPYMESSPSWFQHSDGMRYIYFSNYYDTDKITKTMSVPPASVSSGGGFSGGGSSGGGFGGGGGGSW